MAARFLDQGVEAFVAVGTDFHADASVTTHAVWIVAFSVVMKSGERDSLAMELVAFGPVPFVEREVDEVRMCQVIAVIGVDCKELQEPDLMLFVDGDSHRGIVFFHDLNERLDSCSIVPRETCIFCNSSTAWHR